MERSILQPSAFAATQNLNLYRDGEGGWGKGVGIIPERVSTNYTTVAGTKAKVFNPRWPLAERRRERERGKTSAKKINKGRVKDKSYYWTPCFHSDEPEIGGVETSLRR